MGKAARLVHANTTHGKVDIRLKNATKAGCVWVNHIFDRPGFYTCECVPENFPCLYDGHCFKEWRCPSVHGQPGGCVWVNHVHDHPGYFTCECLHRSAYCLYDGMRVRESNCPSQW